MAFMGVGGSALHSRTWPAANKFVREPLREPPTQSKRESRSVTDAAGSACLDNAAFIAALNALAPADLLRLRKKSAYRAMGTGMEGDDLLNEAIQRTLDEDGRNCPADVSVVVYLDNAMRSIADGEREKYARRRPAGDGHDETSPVGKLADNNPSPADAALDRIEFQRVINRIEVRRPR